MSTRPKRKACIVLVRPASDAAVGARLWPKEKDEYVWASVDYCTADEAFQGYSIGQHKALAIPEKWTDKAVTAFVADWAHQGKQPLSARKAKELMRLWEIKLVFV